MKLFTISSLSTTIYFVVRERHSSSRESFLFSQHWNNFFKKVTIRFAWWPNSRVRPQETSFTLPNNHWLNSLTKTRLQKHIIRIITKSKYDAHTAPLLYKHRNKVGMEIKTNKRWEKNMKMNKLEKSEAFIHPIGIKYTQSVNESHLNYMSMITHTLLSAVAIENCLMASWTHQIRGS